MPTVRVFRWALVLLASLALPQPSTAADWPSLAEPIKDPKRPGRQDAALIIAIEDYAFVEDVQGAGANARDWDRWLDARGVPISRTVVLRDSAAVREEILDQAQRTAREVPAGGTLWVVFIGHGAPSKDGRDGVLVGADAQQKATSIYARGVERRELVAALAGGKQAETVLILDACFSGKSSGGGALIPGLQPLIPVSLEPVARVTVLSAGAGDEFAGPLPGMARPAFTYLVLGALHGWNEADEDGDGQVNLGEAVAYSRGALRRVITDRRQTPEIVGPLAGLPVARAQQPGPDLRALGEAPGQAVGIDWVPLPGGTFRMGFDTGGEKPVHQVTLPAFEMGRTEVTNAQWKACVAAGKCPELGLIQCWDERTRAQVEGPCPVVNVTWHEANTFATWAGGRLPTEDEWEYAARSAGKSQTYPWGDEAATCTRVVIDEGGHGCGQGDFAWAVCSKPAGNTAQGLCDMGGNAWEWTADWHGPYEARDQSNPSGPADGVTRVIRSGSWSTDAAWVRAALRGGRHPDIRNRTQGFRLVRRR